MFKVTTRYILEQVQKQALSIDAALEMMEELYRGSLPIIEANEQAEDDVCSLFGLFC